MTITEFLLARIAEDEAEAREASIDGATWAVAPPHDMSVAVFCVDSEWVVAYDEGNPSPSQAAHIARHDPARVLAECEAKRRIIERAEHVAEQIASLRCDEGEDRFSLAAAKFESEATCRALASVYADHPDYDQAWRI